MIKNIAIFASGSGSNAEAIIKHFEESDIARVRMIFSNKKSAFVHERARKLSIPSMSFVKDELNDENSIVLHRLRENEIDFIVLAGFLLKVPECMVNEYSGRIVNIHPALLPAYGGKGMYGSFVHKAVLEAGEDQSGITIHYVNKKYDEGNIIFQATCPVMKEDSAETLAQRIHKLEHMHYPQIIEQLIFQLED